MPKNRAAAFPRTHCFPRRPSNLCVFVHFPSIPTHARIHSPHLHPIPQVYELENFQVTFASRYPSPILSMGLAPDCSLLAVGMADGTLSMRRARRPRVAGLGTASSEGEQTKRIRCVCVRACVWGGGLEGGGGCVAECGS
jgi:hypothetical protein